MIAAARLRGATADRIGGIAPLMALALAAIAARTSFALLHPRLAALLLLWLLADTATLGLIVRAPDRRPGAGNVIAALAGAAVGWWMILPAPLHAAMLHNPAFVAAPGLLVLAHGGLAARRTRHLWSRERAWGARLRGAAAMLLPPILVRLAAAELAILHLALFRWRAAPDVPAGARGFAYHRHLTPLCVTLLVLSGLEVAVYHLLLGAWAGRGAAALLFVLSDVGLVYLVGFIKSLRLRPVLLTRDAVRVRAGMLLDVPVPLERIAAVTGQVDGAEVRAGTTLNAALLAWPNVLIRLDAPIVHRRRWRQRRIDALAFRLDDPAPFLRLLRWRLALPPER